MTYNRVIRGDRSDGQTEQVMDNEFQQLLRQVQALQVPRSIHPTLRLRDLDDSHRHRRHYTDI
ncbi:hypothetical protein DPMN_091535 [Dreissena polymorpha]|uniref:Uncharacterized protein n=1 Tax=Dreissena polymorpha TaxID=45954 RepID=A0A9D4L0N8_DREPO|nr:hypothetical protein DPMN_091535 [Dreissena polymorpha]